MAARAILLLCIQARLKDLNTCWGDTSGIITYKEDPRRQPQGFRPEQVMRIVLDRQCKMLYGVPDTGHDGVWCAGERSRYHFGKGLQVVSRSGPLRHGVHVIAKSRIGKERQR